MEEALEDELMSINSIYEEGTLEIVDKTRGICTLKLPIEASIILRLEFSADYPNVPPSILGTESIGDSVPKGMGKQVVELARELLFKLYIPGEPMVYSLVEELVPLINEELQAHVTEETQPMEEATVPTEELGPAPPWTITPTTTEKKSIFVARCAAVNSLAQAKQHLAHLLATDRRVAKATHNITAWRIRSEDGTSVQDCDDDGETAAGGRLLKLLQVVDVWNVMVVVTRWYGGVKLGPDRFRIINNVAREGLVMGEFILEDAKKKK